MEAIRFNKIQQKGLYEMFLGFTSEMTPSEKSLFEELKSIFSRPKKEKVFKQKSNTTKFVVVLDEIYDIDKKLGIYTKVDDEVEILPRYERILLENKRVKLVKKAVVYHGKITEEDFNECYDLCGIFYDGSTWVDFTESIGYY